MLPDTNIKQQCHRKQKKSADTNVGRLYCLREIFPFIIQPLPLQQQELLQREFRQQSPQPLWPCGYGESS